jgi:hypothetical protein
MPEGKEGLDLKLKRIKSSVGGAAYDAKRFLKETDLKLDRDAVAAKELFEEVAPCLGFLTNPNNLPKILEVKSSSREFVSIRRVEGVEFENRFIKVIEPENKDPFNTLVMTTVSPNTISEGQILVIDTPGTIDLKCKRDDVEQKILEELGDRIQDFANFIWLAMMSDRPELFKQEDWEPSGMQVVLVTKKGGKFFYTHVYKNYEDRPEYIIREFDRLKNEKGKQAEICVAGYFQSTADLEANKYFLRKWGRAYVLIEGSSEKGREKRTVSKLNFAPSVQSVS